MIPVNNLLQSNLLLFFYLTHFIIYLTIFKFRLIFTASKRPLGFIIRLNGLDETVFIALNDKFDQIIPELHSFEDVIGIF